MERPLKDNGTLRAWLLATVAIIVTGLALRAMTPVLVPVVFALFLSLVVAPIARWISDRMPRPLKWLGLMAALAVVLAIFALFGFGFWIGGRQIAAEFSDLPERTDQLMQNAGLADRELLGVQIEPLLSNLADRSMQIASSVAQTMVNWTAAGLAGLVISVFLVLMMLAEAPQWTKKLSAATDSDRGRACRSATEIIAHKLRLYLMARAAMGLVTAALYVGWLWLFDLDLLLVWGLLTFLLSFVPNLGSVVSGLLPVLYALLTKDWSTALLIGGGLFVIEQIIGNYVDPKFQGRQVALSPLVILVSILLWGWIWGLPGTLLGVPVMIAILIAAAHVQELRPLALLMSDRTSYDCLDAVVLEEDRDCEGN
ncbi:AI-2E family transporter [Histidinibacterium aquaticum]|uniref:AI-2E family transporter n=1 Tax=Histidinibacterium aquaticum TaxID=2613962 RepID=A0A5J5GQI0_9RHOB|nr:AI-2E family transporter [Histidinibacterium aquaticum]KAA9010325.1 AI-2E family transporter [Histidinibacterium aquaticum]